MHLKIRINDAEMKIEARPDPFSFYTILNEYPKNKDLGESVTVPMENGKVIMNGRLIPGTLYFNEQKTKGQMVFVEHYPRNVIGWKQLSDLGLPEFKNNRGYVADVPPVLLDGEEEPRYSPQMYLRKSLIDDARRVLRSWERKGIIEKCTSVCNSPIHLSTKLNGKVKIIFNYGDLNDCVQSEPSTIDQNRQKVIASTRLGKYYSVLRLFYGEWSIPLDTNTKYKTAFTFLGRQYIWNRLPGKFKNRCTIVSKTLGMILDKMPQNIRKLVTFYIDTMLISADTEDECHQFTKLLWCHLEDNGFEMQDADNQICKPRVEFLGREICPEGIRLGPSFLEKVKGTKPPKNARCLRSTLSRLQDAKRFTPGFSIFAKELNKLRNEKSNWVFENKHRDALYSLKNHILDQKRFLVPGLKENEMCTVQVFAKEEAWMAEILNSDKKPYCSESGVSRPLQKKVTEAVWELKAIQKVWNKHKTDLAARQVTWEVESPELAFFKEDPDCVKINKRLDLTFLFTTNHKIKVIPAHKRRPPIPWPVDN